MSKKIETLLKKATSYEKLAIFSDRKVFLQALSQQTFSPEEVKQWGNLDEFGNPIQTGIPPVPPATNTPTTMPETTIIGHPPAKFPTISKTQQAALSKIVSLDGIGIPLQRIDGLLGPETKAALKAFKNHYQMNDVSDAQALQYAQTLADLEPKYQL